MHDVGQNGRLGAAVHFARVVSAIRVSGAWNNTRKSASNCAVAPGILCCRGNYSNCRFITVDWYKLRHVYHHSTVWIRKYTR